MFFTKFSALQVTLCYPRCKYWNDQRSCFHPGQLQYLWLVQDRSV